MEESPKYQASSKDQANARPPVEPLNDPDFIGAEAAMKRASAKAVAQARAAGLEPVVATPEQTQWMLDNPFGSTKK